ncbi:unnamed protein product, partial [marine sediment metagenome]
CGSALRGKGVRPLLDAIIAYLPSPLDIPPVLFESIHFSEPVLSMAIESKTKADQDKLDDALAKLAEEDPTFKFYNNQETGQVLISGMGELHLEVMAERILRRYDNLPINGSETTLKAKLARGASSLA